ncbi:MAG: hypothetical protein K2G36_03835 [Ruminococcus sp.]|nr:hypothetical protein [Ruminococcus sp.]
MKRLVSMVVMIVTVVMFVGCTSPIKPETSRKNGLKSAFESKVNISIDKLNAEGIVKRFGEGVWDVEFSEPNTLSGVKLAFDGGVVTASYKGLDFSVPQSAMPVKAMMMNLIEAVDTNARLEELKGSEKDNVLEVTGSLDGGDYVISVGKDGRLVSFDMENNKLKMIFSDMKEMLSSTPETTSDTTATTTTEPVTETVTESETEPESEATQAEDVFITPEENAEEVIEFPESAEETFDIIGDDTIDFAEEY